MQACKQIAARHRLILTGTPIQNSIIELWSLFDFLMPGFLGSEALFNRRFGKALAQARTSKRGSAQAQAGLLAVDSLHKQVMPILKHFAAPQLHQSSLFWVQLPELSEPAVILLTLNASLSVKTDSNRHVFGYVPGLS